MWDKVKTIAGIITLILLIGAGAIAATVVVYAFALAVKDIIACIGG